MSGVSRATRLAPAMEPAAFTRAMFCCPACQTRILIRALNVTLDKIWSQLSLLQTLRRTLLLPFTRAATRRRRSATWRLYPDFKPSTLQRWLERTSSTVGTGCLHQQTSALSAVRGNGLASQRSSVAWGGGGGKVKLPPLRPAPPVLRRWFQDDEFRKQIRSYNQVFTFTSLGASCGERGFRPVAEDHNVQGQRGVYTYRIQGAMGHFMGSLLPPMNPVTGEPVTPKFAQIYIFDPEIEGRVARWRGVFFGLDREALMDLEHMMEEVNPFPQQYLSMGAVLRERVTAGEDPVNVIFRLRANNREGPRTHNLPTTSEVAAILVEDVNTAYNRDLLLYSTSRRLTRLFETDNIYDPLQYPLLFPFGELGWTYSDKYANGAVVRNKREMALREHVAYRLFQKKDDQSVLHQGGRLFQRVVDQRAKCEQENLRWIANNQKELRADLYYGIADAFLNENPVASGGNDVTLTEYNRATGTLETPHAGGGARRHFLEQVGQRVVLPATHTGSPRYFYDQFQDAMPMVRELGKPDIFMTVTCNPL